MLFGCNGRPFVMASSGPASPPPKCAHRGQRLRNPADGYDAGGPRPAPSKQPLSESAESVASRHSASKRRKLDPPSVGAAASAASSSSSSSSSASSGSQVNQHEGPHSDTVSQALPSCRLDPASFTTAGRPPQSLQVLQMIEGSALGAAIQASLQGSNAPRPVLPALVNVAPPLGLLSHSSLFAALPSSSSSAAPSAPPVQLNRAAVTSVPHLKPVLSCTPCSAPPSETEELK